MGTGEMAQPLKNLSLKHDSMSLVARTHRVEGIFQLLKLGLCSPYTWHDNSSHE